mgnify:FL=1
MSIFVKAIGNKPTTKEFCKDLPHLQEIYSTKLKLSIYDGWEQTANNEMYDNLEFKNAKCIVVIIPNNIVNLSLSDLAFMAKIITDKSNQTVVYFEGKYNGYIECCLGSLASSLQSTKCLMSSDINSTISFIDYVLKLN